MMLPEDSGIAAEYDLGSSEFKILLDETDVLQSVTNHYTSLYYCEVIEMEYTPTNTTCTEGCA